MSKAKLWTGVVLVFVSGLVMGSLVTGHFLRQHMLEFVGRGPVGANRHIVARMTRDLDLSEEQAAAVEEIRLRTEARMIEVGREFFPLIEEILTKQAVDIEAVLDEEQRRTFNDRVEKLREKHEEMKRRLMDPPPGRQDA
jgi:hypothetical protein